MWWIVLIASFLSWYIGQHHQFACIRNSQSLIIIKPDVLQRNLQAVVMKDLSALDVTCCGQFIWTKRFAANFYREHKVHAFYPDLIESLVGKESIFVMAKSPV